MAKLDVGSLGDYIREQRGHAQYSLRQLAELAGVSNPYLSQIERGLRKPSAEILQQIAKGLRISAETLYIRAGILDEHDGDQIDVRVPVAVVSDPGLTERQKRVLLDIYSSFRTENAGRETGAATPEPGAIEPLADEAMAEQEPAPVRRPRAKRAKPRPARDSDIAQNNQTPTDQTPTDQPPEGA